MAFKLPTLRDLPRQITSDLLSFDYEDITDEKPIAKGGFGFVYKATTIKIKRSSSRRLQANRQAMKICFLKEAKLINSLRHVNVVGFMGLCTLPCAIMLEYVAFDFSRFGHSKLSTNLGDFLNYIDRIDGFENCNDKLHAKVFSDVAVGLAYLHDKDTAHRDLKPKNILVSNQHYCDIKEDDQRWAAFEKAPICCKLADFGESKSRQIQTAVSNTNLYPIKWKRRSLFKSHRHVWGNTLQTDSVFSTLCLHKMEKTESV